MSMPVPPQLAAAYTQLSESLTQLEGKPVDLAALPWAEVEKSLIKVLGGAFSLQNPQHQMVGLGLAAAFAERLAKDHAVFWFPSRDAMEGAELGFAEVLMKLSPLGAVVDALSSARLAKLDEVSKEIRTALGKMKFGVAANQAMRLGPEDYMRIYDAGFVQLVALDQAKAAQGWKALPTRVSIDLREGLSRATKLPAEVRQQLEQQLLSALGKMDPNAPVISQVARAPRVVELMGLLFGATAATGSAPEEFWTDVVLPLLLIGVPTSFPPLDDEEAKVAAQGVDPLFLFLDVVPHQFKIPGDEGLLGVFPMNEIGLPDPAFETLSSVRLLKVGAAALREPLRQFDPEKTRDALARFTAHVRAKTGPIEAQGAQEAKQMFDAALSLLGDLKALVETGKDLCVRRLTEGEAATEPALAMVRQSIQGPRIILTS